MEDYKIISGENTFPASDYQCKIFDAVEHGVGNLIINAAAGSSKTTTIVNAVRFIPKKKKVLFLAFNRDIVEKLKSTIAQSNVTVLTFHQLGFKILLENKICQYNSPDLINEYKYVTYVNQNIDQLSSFKETKSLGKKKVTYLTNIKQLIEYSRYYLAFTLKEIERVANIYGVIPVRDEFKIVREVLQWGEKHTDTIDYTDMLWLPNVLNLVTKKYQSNWIFIDEAQDTSIVEQQLVEKCFKRGTRFAAVGDVHQQINIWAGSTEQAIENFKKKPHTKEFQLPISYRCPKKVVELAKNYSDNIIAKDDAIEGEILYDVLDTAPQSGDMVLCRTTAPLVDLFVKYLRLNKKVFLNGSKNVKDEYIRLIDNSKAKLIDNNCITSDGLIPTLFIQLFNLIERTAKNYGITEDEAIASDSILLFYDNILGLKVLSEGLYTTEELKDKINTIFGIESDEDIMLSTVHKAKGLEANNVYIYMPSLMPCKLAKKKWEIDTENNLIYVAYTRAKKTLSFIKEKEYQTKNGQFNYNNLSSILKQVKEKIKYNKELGLSENDYKETPHSAKTITLGSTLPMTNQNKSSRVKGGLKMRNLLK